MSSKAHPWSRLILAVLALVVAFAALPASAAAQDDDDPQVTWKRYDVTVQVREDGTLRVTESIDIEFNGVFRQGTRTIPMDRIESIDEVEVSVGPGPGDLTTGRPTRQTVLLEPGEFNARRDGSDFVIDYGFNRTSIDGSDRIRTVEVAYTAHGAIRVYPDATPPEQQVRWTAISSEVTSTGPVETASATVIFPEEIPEARLSTDPDPTAVEADRVIWEREDLGEGASLQVAVAFPPVTDAVAPAWQADADTYEGRQEHLPAIHLILGLVALVTWVITILFMVVRGVRDPEVGLVADIIPNRPSDLAAPLVGTLVDEMVETKDALAGLLDLDRQGIVTIREEPTLKKGKSDYQIVLNRPIAGAATWERPMLEGLFGKDATPGEEVDLAKQLKELRQKSFSKIVHAYDEELFARGFFIEHPQKTRLRWVAIIAGIFLLLAAIVAVVSVWARMLSPLVVIPGVITLFGVITAGVLTTKAAVKTTEGAVEAAKWRAYARYLKDLRKGPTPGRFIEELEQNLPWAVALGFDSSWSKLADDLSTSLPEDARDRRRRGTWHTPVFVGGGFGDGSPGSSTGSAGSGGGDLQGASTKALSAIGGGSAGIFAMLNDASASFNAGSSSGGSSGGFSGSSSVGSSGGGGHSFS